MKFALVAPAVITDRRALSRLERAECTAVVPDVTDPAWTDYRTLPASSLRYSPALDGLRGVAVLSVLLFHLQPGLLRGGFVGVDIFFVISGYLITGILLRDCRRGHLSLAKFYQRRIARLFPSLILVCSLTLIASAVLFVPENLADTASHTAQTVLSWVNLKYMVEQGGYWGITKDSHPLLHCWSLSVEEQFYLLFPTALYCLCRFAPRRVSTVLVAIAALSFGTCVVLTPQHPAWAFYLLPTRAWELLAGAILANLTADRKITPGVRVTSTWIGLGVIALSFVLVREANFPGWQALLPVAGAAAVILGIVNNAGSSDRLLSSKPMVSIGRQSYTLYLWHWPIFCLVDYGCYTAPDRVRLLLKLVLTAGATVLTYHLIESPARIYLNRPDKRRWAFTFAATALLILVPASLWVRKHNLIDATPYVVSRKGILLNAKATGPSLVLMGDSHASRLGTSLRDLSYGMSMRVFVISMSGEEPLPGGKLHDRAWKASLQAVEQIRPDYLVIECAWYWELADHPGRLQAAIDMLRPHAQHIILITEPPILPPEGTRSGIRRGARPPFVESTADRAARMRANQVVRASQGVTVIDTESLFLDSNGRILFTDDHGHQLYYDREHLSRYGADRITPLIASAVKQKTRLARNGALEGKK